MFVQLLVASQSLVTLSMSVLYYYYYHLLVEIILINYHKTVAIVKNRVSQDCYNNNKNIQQQQPVSNDKCIIEIEKNINNNNKDNNCNLISAELEKQLLLLQLSGNKKFNLVQCNLREKWPIVHTLVAYRNVDL